MVQGMQETLAETIDMSIFAAETGYKHAFIRLIEMPPTDVEEPRLLHNFIRNSFE